MGELRKQYKLQKERRNRYIKNLIEESIINVLAEQEVAQQSVAQQPVVQQPVVQQPANTVVPQQDPSPPPPVVTPDTRVPTQYTVDDMIDELNTIRSGRSFTDPEIYGRLVTFFKNLGEEQKSNLDTLLTQIAELVTGVDDAQSKQQQQGQPGQAQSTPPPEAPQVSAPMPGAQQAAGAAGVGAV